MRQEADPSNQRRNWIPGVVILAFLLVASIWATTYFSAEARVRRATARVVRCVEKPGEESAVALGLAANRLGKFLATNAVLEVPAYGALATGRTEIVQLFAQTRSWLEAVAFDDPVIATAAGGKGVVTARVTARYRLVPAADDAAEGRGTVELRWAKKRDGWQIERAFVQAEDRATMPGGWK